MTSDLEAVEADILDEVEQLGYLLATPAINELAAKRREKKIEQTRGEIVRLQGVLADVLRERKEAGSEEHVR